MLKSHLCLTLPRLVSKNGRLSHRTPIRLRLSHPDYSAFDGIEHANREQNPSIENLRSKTAKIVLKRMAAAKTDDEAPHFVVALAPIEEAEIDKTWDPVGLAGTGSHDVVFNNVFVPWEHIFDWPDSTPNFGYPTAVFVPGGWSISICAAAAACHRPMSRAG